MGSLLYYAMGKTDEGAPWYRKSIEANPANYLPYLHLGDYERDRGNYEEAIALYKKSLELDVENAKRHYGHVTNLRIAKTYSDHHKYDEAETWYEKALEREQLDLYDASHYFIHLHRAGAPDKAREYIAGRSGQLENDDWIAPLVHFYAGEITEDSLLSRTEAEDPDTDKEQKCEAYYYLGMAHLLGIHSSVPADTAKAIDYFEKCLGTNVVTYVEYVRAGQELLLLEAR